MSQSFKLIQTKKLIVWERERYSGGIDHKEAHYFRDNAGVFSVACFQMTKPLFLSFSLKPIRLAPLHERFTSYQDNKVFG